MHTQDMVRGKHMKAINDWHDQTVRETTEVLVVVSNAEGIITANNGAGDVYAGAEAQFTPLFRNLLNFHYNDVDIQRANNAHNGTSWTPERRGYLYADGYASKMSALDEHFSVFVTDDNRQELVGALEAYRVKYLALMWAFLHSHANCVSSAISGPSGFNTHRAEKRSRWASNHLNEWVEWQKQAEDRLDKEFNPASRTNRAISSDDSDALERLREKLAGLESQKALMRAANKIVKSSKKTDDQKITELQKLSGITEHVAKTLLQPDDCGQVGFADYQLSNNNANIKRVRDRISRLERNQSAVTTEQQIGAVQIIEDVENNRVKVLFPERLSTEMYQAMRHGGFVWSPSNQAFQRKRSPQASRLAQQLAEQYQQEKTHGNTHSTDESTL